MEDELKFDDSRILMLQIVSLKLKLDALIYLQRSIRNALAGSLD